jgi:hypothetical protein
MAQRYQDLTVSRNPSLRGEALLPLSFVLDSWLYRFSAAKTPRQAINHKLFEWAL